MSVPLVIVRILGLFRVILLDCTERIAGIEGTNLGWCLVNN